MSREVISCYVSTVFEVAPDTFYDLLPIRIVDMIFQHCNLWHTIVAYVIVDPRVLFALYQISVLSYLAYPLLKVSYLTLWRGNNLPGVASFLPFQCQNSIFYIPSTFPTIKYR